MLYIIDQIVLSGLAVLYMAAIGWGGFKVVRSVSNGTRA